MHSHFWIAFLAFFAGIIVGAVAERRYSAKLLAEAQVASQKFTTAKTALSKAYADVKKDLP